MSWIADALRGHPELAFFAALGSGHLLGRIRLGPFRIDPVIGVLLAGIVIGQVGVVMPGALSWTFFSLFLFAVGYEAGPQFFRGLGRGALPQLALTFLFAATATLGVLFVSQLLALDAGTSGGLLAGGLTDSAAFGAAGMSVSGLALADEARATLATNLTVAFAVTYLPGLIASIFVLTKLAPWLLRVDLAASCLELEQELGVGAEPAGTSAYRDIEARVYRLPDALDGVRVDALERSFLPDRVFVERVRHAGTVRESDAGLKLSSGDHVALIGRHEVLVGAERLRDHEAVDAELLDFPIVEAQVVATRRELAGLSLGAIEKRIAEEVATRGVHVLSVRRGGREIPLGLATVVERGDVLVLSGVRSDVERVASTIGAVEWPEAPSDLAMLGIAIALGGLIGLPHLVLGGIGVGLSLPVGVLLGSLVAGWLRSTLPVFGHVPEPVLRLFETLGLTGFLALVGLSAGPQFVRGLAESGVPLLVAGTLVCMVPHLVTLAVGRFVFRMHPALLLGLCAGAGTAPAALAAVQSAARSKVPTLGYSVPFAVGHVLLALAAGIIVALRAA